IAPQTTSYHCQRVTEGRLLFGVPSRRANDLRLVFDQGVGHQRHQRKQPEQNWRRTRNCQIAPLPLRLDSQMRPRFFKGHLQSPTSHEPRQNPDWLVCQFGREKSARLEFSEHVAHQHPTDRHIRLAAGAPQTGLAVDLDLSRTAAVPVLDLDLLPLCLWVFQPLLWRSTARAFDAGPTPLTWLAFRREVVQL